MTDHELLEVFNKIPAPSPGATFTPRKVQMLYHPHPFVIGPKHVAHASDHYGGMLGEATLSAIPCAGCRLDYDEHESHLSLIIEVPQNHDLNAIDGLHDYLLSIKDLATALNIDGFAFPTRSQL